MSGELVEWLIASWRRLVVARDIKYRKPSACHKVNPCSHQVTSFYGMHSTETNLLGVKRVEKMVLAEEIFIKKMKPFFVAVIFITT